jgi:hypothetical protein
MILALLLAACHKTPNDGICVEKAEQLGFVPCVHALATHEEFEAVSVQSEAVDQTWITKFLVPTGGESAIDQSVFVDAQRYALHQDFLSEVFPEEFSGLTSETYAEMVLNPDERVFYSGSLTEYIDADGETFLGFRVWDRGQVVEETVTLEEITEVWEALVDRVGFGDLHFVPRNKNQLEAAAGWDAPFPIVDVSANVTYEAYTQGEGYGTLRLYTLEELDTATGAGEYGFQDILVLDEAPWDLEMVVSGLITGTRQGQLSHLNVRSASRGTPNCFIASPHALLEIYEGLLVHLTCDEAVWRIEETTLSEAEAFWETLRPDPVDILSPDLQTTALVGLLELDTESSGARTGGVAAYGSKGANLAALYQRISSDLQLDGFLVPASAYDQFMRENTWSVDLGSGETEASFQETIDSWLASTDFRNDTAWRLSCLGDFRDAMETAVVDPDLLTNLGAAIESTWGNDTTMVRFRSSSNAEDALTFSGAGLYDSTSACLADQRDGDEVGPSRCDSDKDNERSLERALRRVWSSLWKVGAYEEREWYGIDHSLAAMGILVNTRSADEQANIVLFSGDPVVIDDRFLVNAQVGEFDVVSSEPGVIPEVARLTIDNGAVVAIEREQASSESGAWVLSTEQLHEIGEAMADIEGVYPVDGEIPGDQRVLLDTEWKVLVDGRLVIKQIRPFLR